MKDCVIQNSSARLRHNFTYGLNFYVEELERTLVYKIAKEFGKRITVTNKADECHVDGQIFWLVKILK